MEGNNNLEYTSYEEYSEKMERRRKIKQKIKNSKIFIFTVNCVGILIILSVILLFCLVYFAILLAAPVEVQLLAVVLSLISTVNQLSKLE